MSGMGKNSGSKKEANGVRTRSVSAFFAPKRSPSEKQLGVPDSPKMADGREEPQGGGMAITRTEFFTTLENLEKNMAAFTAELIKPIASQIAEFRADLEKVSQTAETAMENSLAIQDETRYLLQREDWATDKILSLDNQLRAHNVKFRGIPEQAEENSELSSFIAQWLASTLKLESGIAPLLDYAYRLGPLKQVRQKAYPRDIVVKFSHLRTKSSILAQARAKGFLVYKDSKIQVLQDLSPETLYRRKTLKPITSVLMEAKIKYRWVAHCKLQVIHQDRTLYASDFETGVTLLQVLKLKIPTELHSADREPEKPKGNSRWLKAERNRLK